MLNFGVAAYSILHQMRILDDRVYRFHPDVVVVTDGRQPEGPIVQHLTRVLADRATGTYPELDSILRRAGMRDFPGRGVPVPTAPLRRVVQAAGIHARMPEREVALRAYSALDEIVAWSLRHIAQQARAHGAVPVFVDGMFPIDSVVSDTPMMRSARDAGFLVISLAKIWDGQPRDSLRLGAWDNHPNARAMRMIGEGLYRELQRHDAELHLFK